MILFRTAPFTICQWCLAGSDATTTSAYVRMFNIASQAKLACLNHPLMTKRRNHGKGASCTTRYEEVDGQSLNWSTGRASQVQTAAPAAPAFLLCVSHFAAAMTTPAMPCNLAKANSEGNDMGTATNVWVFVAPLRLEAGVQ